MLCNYKFPPHNACKLQRNKQATSKPNQNRWHIPAENWNLQYNIEMHMSCLREERPTYIVHYIQKFNGVRLLKNITESGLEYLKKAFAYMVIMMNENSGDRLDFDNDI